MSVVLVAVIVVVATLGVLTADVGAVLHGRARATIAADAAALAAAPVTFRPFGAKGSPAREASLFARANGAELLVCRCPRDGSFRSREVVVEVRVAVRTNLLGRRSITATSRARFDPVALRTQDSAAHGRYQYYAE